MCRDSEAILLDAMRRIARMPSLRANPHIDPAHIAAAALGDYSEALRAERKDSR